MKHYFEGRIARLNYFLAGLVISIIVGVLTNVAGNVIGGVVAVIGMVFSISLSIRRFHDMGWSGWHALWFIVPIVNIIFAIILLFKTGTAGSNLYGAEPSKAVDVLGTLFPKASVTSSVSAPMPMA